MDYFQGVVVEYLRANRSTFVNTECLIQVEPGDAPAKGTSWYCDAVALDMKHQIAYLCEVTYSKSLHALAKRLQAWNDAWPQICDAIHRDCSIPKDFKIMPWVFVPKTSEDLLRAKLSAYLVNERNTNNMPYPKIEFLENVTPWNYRSWNRESSD